MRTSMPPKHTRKHIQKVFQVFAQCVNSDGLRCASWHTEYVEAVDALSQAVALLTERGRFASAANNQKQIAEIYESDIVDFEKAMGAYEKAADWYSGEDSMAYVFSLSVSESSIVHPSHTILDFSSIFIKGRPTIVFSKLPLLPLS